MVPNAVIPRLDRGILFRVEDRRAYTFREWQWWANGRDGFRMFHMRLLLVGRCTAVLLEELPAGSRWRWA